MHPTRMAGAPPIRYTGVPSSRTTFHKLTVHIFLQSELEAFPQVSYAMVVTQSRSGWA